jgi:hypothetical protein
MALGRKPPDQVQPASIRQVVLHDERVDFGAVLDPLAGTARARGLDHSEGTA